MILDKLVSAIKNDIYGGLAGMHSNLSISDELLADDIVDERLLIIKEYQLKGILPLGDLLLSINCIPVDCKPLEKCRCLDEGFGDPIAHFEIPQIINDYGTEAILYIGSVDKMNPFLVYINAYTFNLYHKYRRRGKSKPYIWIDTTPNENGYYDCFVFNAPLLKTISVIGVFKDPRLLEAWGCCDDNSDDNFSWMNNEIKKRLITKKLLFYRLLKPVNTPNDQSYK